MRSLLLKKVLTFICILNVLGEASVFAGIIQDNIIEKSIAECFPDGKVTMTNLRNLKELEVINKKITSLEGFSNCSNIEKITFISCGIEDISSFSELVPKNWRSV